MKRTIRNAMVIVAVALMAGMIFSGAALAEDPMAGMIISASDYDFLTGKPAGEAALSSATIPSGTVGMVPVADLQMIAAPYAPTPVRTAGHLAKDDDRFGLISMADYWFIVGGKPGSAIPDPAVAAGDELPVGAGLSGE